MATKKKASKSVSNKKRKSLPKQSYDPVNKNYLIIIGAVIAVLVVLLATIVINRSKLQVKSGDSFIDVTPGMVSEE